MIYYQAGNTLISRSEFQWDSTDKRWGMGDYRLPNQMTTAMDGTKIPSSTWPYKGIDRNEKVLILSSLKIYPSLIIAIMIFLYK